MFSTLPARIIEIDSKGLVARADAIGRILLANLTFVPDAALGDIVLIHAGFAVAIMDRDEALKTWPLLEEIDNYFDNHGGAGEII